MQPGTKKMIFVEMLMSGLYSNGEYQRSSLRYTRAGSNVWIYELWCIRNTHEV